MLRTRGAPSVGAGVATGGAGAAVAGVGTVAAIAGELAKFHADLKGTVTAFNSKLENTHLSDMRELAEEKFVAASNGLSDSDLTRTSWQPE